jgi:Uma2 family endonuclease
MVLSWQDLDLVQHQLENDYRLELVNGEVRVMSPSGYQSDEVASEFSRQIGNWIRPRQLGRVTGAGAGFSLPNANIRSPDVSFVRAERLRTSPTRFADLAPDLVVEVKSPSDSLTTLRAKVDDFLQQGSLVGIVINPEQRWLEVRRGGQAPVLFQDGDRLSLPDLLPGWELDISELWSPVF